MPRPNEHICELHPASGYDRIRNEAESEPHPMHVAGKRVYRTYGFDGDKSDVIMFRFPRKDGWAKSEGAARTFCESHQGNFMPMTGEATATMFAASGEPLQVLCAVSAEAGADGLCWHPFIPIGKFAGHNQVGEFEITAADLEQMADNFSRGLPFGAGVPIDEDGLHQVRGEGAYGWIEALEVREAQLWGGIRWTADGEAAIQSGKYRYVSPHFFLGGYPNQEWLPSRGSLLFSAALCTRPFFREQPELQIAAAQLFPVLAAQSEQEQSQQQERSRAWGIEVRPDGHLTPPQAYVADCPAPGDYGDPVNYLYPLKPEARARNAAARMAQNYSKYQQEASRRVVWTRIVRREKALGIECGAVPALNALLPPDLRPAH